MSPSAARVRAAAAWALALALSARVVSMASLPLTDPTEGRYAQVAQEMSRTGDWVTPRVWMNESLVPFLGKPPLFFWSAAAAMRVFGENEFAARLPSALAALVLLGLLFRVMETYGGKGLGLLSVLVTASCGFFLAVSGCAAVDMVFSACVAGALLSYFAFVSETDRTIRRRWSLLVFALLALGVLTKGPVAVVLFGLPVLAWTIRWREWRALRDHAWLAGGAVFLLLAAPWYVLCEVRNPGFLTYFFLNENLLRFLTHNYGDAYGSGHLYPRGSALVMFLAATAPWSFFGLWHAVRARCAPRACGAGNRFTNFLFLSFVAGTLFWCLARQLLFTYVLPLVPLFAAWLVLSVKSEKLRYGMRATATAVLLLLAGTALVCMPCLKGVGSTREIVRLSLRRAAERSFSEPLVFERRTPYSALFYARGWVVTHPKEALGESLGRCEGRANSALVVVRDGRENAWCSLHADRCKELAAAGPWRLLRVALPAAADAVSVTRLN